MGKEQPAKLQITNVSCFFSMDIYMQFLEYVINVVPEYFIVSSKININNFFWQYRVIEIIRKKTFTNQFRTETRHESPCRSCEETFKLSNF